MGAIMMLVGSSICRQSNLVHTEKNKNNNNSNNNNVKTEAL